MTSKYNVSSSGDWETIVLIIMAVATLVIFFVAYANFYGYFVTDIGPTLCRDGWRSGSLGIQGACSHHGGIDYGPINAVRRKSFWSAIFASLMFFIFCFSLLLFISDRVEKSKSTKANDENTNDKPLNIDDESQSVLACPKCGARMLPKSKKTGDAQLQFPSMRAWLQCPECLHREDIMLE